VLAGEFKAGNVRAASFAQIWESAPLVQRMRSWEVGGQCRTCGAYGRCHGGCMAVKYFTGTPLDDPDPECVLAPEG
jgi:radical SAM protein with 4Fe4S-binding SPASM domain